MIRLPTRKRRKMEREGERRGVRGGRERERGEECKEGERGKAERR